MAETVPPDGPAAEVRTVVLGLGNPLLTDDAAGLAVAAELSRRLDRHPLPGVCVRTSTRGGFELIDLLTGFDRAILVDCLALPEPRPGRIRRLDAASVAGSVRLVNSHEIDLGSALQLAATLAIPLPSDVVVYGIEGADPLTFSEQMTPAVERAARRLARRLHDELRQGAASGR